MKTVIATEEVLNKYGDLIRVIYHNEDGTRYIKKVFINAPVLKKTHKAFKR